jgi:hypothetical protein
LIELAKERAHLDAEHIEDVVEHPTAWCQEAISSFCNATARKIRIGARSKRWWNADIKERRQAVRRENRTLNSELAAMANAKLQKSIPQLDSKMWRDYWHNLIGAEVRSATRYAKPRAGRPVEA